jgi:SAM-dependent methyltransferase
MIGRARLTSLDAAEPGWFAPRMDEEYGPSTYGDRVADLYDEWYDGPDHGSLGEVADTVAFLKELAGEGPALELGIGTGRVALPLQEAGVRVHGIDASVAMVTRMEEKPGGDAIPVTIGNFAEFAIDERFTLVFVVFNTFFGLESQEEQVSSFRAIERHLADDGVFVMEAFVPDPARFDRGQRVGVVKVETDVVQLDVTVHDALAQHSTSQHVVIREDGIRLIPVRVRYAFVPELDLMAQLAGLRLRERWAGWKREPFGSSAVKHVSVWERSKGS